MASLKTQYLKADHSDKSQEVGDIGRDSKEDITFNMDHKYVMFKPFLIKKLKTKLCLP